ncbi:hypothetical protein AC578_3893 [Pseudocercospora eumusae]|uniref:Uncharacterized protein n=1 Tax=Pseudocercospora eumusae TaxID=321146 RepID=A0A139GX48_9PEZI|nr:hypothetical protein AC578_3893 [Pseudocercospora eumusae]
MTTIEVYGTYHYSLPDESRPVGERSIYTSPSSKLVKDIPHKLHDFRTDSAFTHGPAGLNVQGFTYVEHISALSGDEFFEGKNVGEIYGPEVCELVKNVTGAKRAIIDGVTLRIRLATETEEDFYHVKLKDGPQDMAMKNFDPSVLRVPGRDRKNAPFEPSRVCRSDYDCQGLKDTVRHCRKDIAEMAKPDLETEDRGESPRYAVHSVWRPIKTVKRDPLGVLD